MSEELTFYPVAGLDELPSGERLFIDLAGVPLVVINFGGEVFAIQDVCTHDDGPLGEGDVDDHQISCPRHGARFDLRTGKVLTLPAIVDVPTYPVRIVDGIIQIGVKE